MSRAKVARQAVHPETVDELLGRWQEFRSDVTQLLLRQEGQRTQYVQRMKMLQNIDSDMRVVGKVQQKNKTLWYHDLYVKLGKLTVLFQLQKKYQEHFHNRKLLLLILTESPSNNIRTTIVLYDRMSMVMKGKSVDLATFCAGKVRKLYHNSVSSENHVPLLHPGFWRWQSGGVEATGAVLGAGWTDGGLPQAYHLTVWCYLQVGLLHGLYHGHCIFYLLFKENIL